MAGGPGAGDTTGVRRASLLPSPRDRLLLLAALGEAPRAEAAFSRWLVATDLEAELGWEVVRLLPLAFQNLRAQGVDHPVLGRFKGVYRRVWYESRQVFHRTAPAVRTLQEAGIDPLVLDDAALALAGYAPPALRPVARLDLLVHSPDLQPAVEALRRAGWRSPSDGTADDLRFADYLQVFSPGTEEAEVRLRWEVLPGGRDRFERPASLSAGLLPGWPETPVGWLHPTFQLLRIVVLRHRADGPSFHWVADAIHLLRSHGDTIDWFRLQQAAKEHRVTGLLATGFQYLVASFGAAVPAAVEAELERHRAPVMERIADAVRSSGRGRNGFPARTPETLWAELLGYLERKRYLGDPVRAILEFSHLLRYRWRLGGRREILPALFRNGASRLSLRAEP